MIILHLHLYKYVHRVCLKKKKRRQKKRSQNKQGKIQITLKIICILFNVPYFTNKHFRCLIITLVIVGSPFRRSTLVIFFLRNTVRRLLDKASIMCLWCVCPWAVLLVAQYAQRHVGTKKGQLIEI